MAHNLSSNTGNQHLSTATTSTSTGDAAGDSNDQIGTNNDNVTTAPNAENNSTTTLQAQGNAAQRNTAQTGQMYRYPHTTAYCDRCSAVLDGGKPRFFDLRGRGPVCQWCFEKPHD